MPRTASESWFVQPSRVKPMPDVELAALVAFCGTASPIAVFKMSGTTAA